MISMVAFSESSVLQRIVGLDRADMPVDVARYMLSLRFSVAEKQRMNELASKASAGQLDEAESHEIDTYLLVSDFLAILHSKARMSLREAPPVR